MERHHWIKRFWLTALIGFSTGPLLAVAATDHGTLTVGHTTIGQCGGRPLIYSGYNPDLSVPTGSYSPTALTGGKTVAAVTDFTQLFCQLNLTILRVSGFTTDPGRSWLTSITCNGITNTATAGSFGFSAGTASWTWAGHPFGLSPLPTGTNVSCTIVHN